MARKQKSIMELLEELEQTIDSDFEILIKTNSKGKRKIKEVRLW